MHHSWGWLTWACWRCSNWLLRLQRRPPGSALLLIGHRELQKLVRWSYPVESNFHILDQIRSLCFYLCHAVLMHNDPKLHPDWSHFWNLTHHCSHDTIESVVDLFKISLDFNKQLPLCLKMCSRWTLKSQTTRKNLFAISTTITATKEISSAALKAFATQDYWFQKCIFTA